MAQSEGVGVLRGLARHHVLGVRVHDVGGCRTTVGVEAPDLVAPGQVVPERKRLDQVGHRLDEVLLGDLVDVGLAGVLEPVQEAERLRDGCVLLELGFGDDGHGFSFRSNVRILYKRVQVSKQYA